MRRSKSVVAAFAASSAVYAVLLVKNFGDVSAANDLLSFLAPEVRAAIMAESTLLLFAIGSHLLAAWLVFRDAGYGAEAVRDAKRANDRAWAFSGEMAAYQERINTQHHELSAKVDRLSDQFVTVIEKLDRLESERERTRDEIRAWARDHLDGNLSARFASNLPQFRRQVRSEMTTLINNYERTRHDQLERDVDSIEEAIKALESRLQSPSDIGSETPS